MARKMEPPPARDGGPADRLRQPDVTGIKSLASHVAEYHPGWTCVGWIDDRAVYRNNRDGRLSIASDSTGTALAPMNPFEKRVWAADVRRYVDVGSFHQEAFDAPLGVAHV